MAADTVMAPAHPGEILLEEFLKPLAVSQCQLAKEIGVPARRINEIVHGQRRARRYPPAHGRELTAGEGAAPCWSGPAVARRHSEHLLSISPRSGRTRGRGGYWLPLSLGRRMWIKA
jgi:hypothetical protein